MSDSPPDSMSPALSSSPDLSPAASPGLASSPSPSPSPHHDEQQFQLEHVQAADEQAHAQHDDDDDVDDDDAVLNNMPDDDDELVDDDDDDEDDGFSSPSIRISKAAANHESSASSSSASLPIATTSSTSSSSHQATVTFAPSTHFSPASSSSSSGHYSSTTAQLSSSFSSSSSSLLNGLNTAQLSMSNLALLALNPSLANNLHPSSFHLIPKPSFKHDAEPSNAHTAAAAAAAHHHSALTSSNNNNSAAATNTNNPLHIRIEQDMQNELFSLRHNKHLTHFSKVQILFKTMQHMITNVNLSHLATQQNATNNSNSLAQQKEKGHTSTTDKSSKGLDSYLSLKNTLINLQSMMLPLLVAPRDLFQHTLHEGETCMHQYHLENQWAQREKLEQQRKQLQEREREKQLEKLNSIDDLISDPSLISSYNTAKNNITNNTPQYEYEYILPHDPCLDNNQVPYIDVVSMLQQLKTRLTIQSSVLQKQYLETTKYILNSQENIGYLKETNRTKDFKTNSQYKLDLALQEKFYAYRKKLDAYYMELVKARAKNEEMKKDMNVQKRAILQANQPVNKQSKKQYEDLLLTLKETKDMGTTLVQNMSTANQERDQLTTQVEILEQAVQTMRYMIKDILRKIDIAESVAPGTPLNASAAPTSTSSSSSDHSNMIECRGVDSSVPKFLQYQGWVRRYELGKRNTELIIKEIWSLKTITDENRRKSGMHRTTLQGFFMSYLKQRFGKDKKKKMEFVYNFVEAMQKYCSDHDVDLFYKVLFQQCSEERYIDQMTMMSHFKKCLMQMDLVDGVRDGLIHKMVFFAGLRQFFPVKSEHNMRLLIDIVLREMQSLSAQEELQVDTRKLLEETSDGDESEFMDAIRNQYEEEVNAFPEEIKAALWSASKDVWKEGVKQVDGGWLTAGQIAAIIHELDKNKSTSEVESYIRRGLGIDQLSGGARANFASAQSSRATTPSHAAERAKSIDAAGNSKKNKRTSMNSVEIKQMLNTTNSSKDNNNKSSSSTFTTPSKAGNPSRRSSGHYDINLSAGVVSPRTSSRNRNSNLSPQPTTNSAALLGYGESSYDPKQWVELTPFLENLNTLFLHRTGHYNADLDMGNLQKLIKEENEKQADEERKIREAEALKRGLGTGLQVDCSKIPGWSITAYSWKRLKDNQYIRDDQFEVLSGKYAGKHAQNLHYNNVVCWYKGDMTKLKIDAVVNAANTGLYAGGGICGAIFNAAGPALSKACAKLGGCNYGNTKITPGYKLPCRYILHSVSPVDNNPDTLVSCYRTILDLCLKYELKSVAFCCLATGIYGFPNVAAAEIALRTVREWMDQDEVHSNALSRIVFCTFLEEDTQIYQSLMHLFFPVPAQPSPAASPSPPPSATTSLTDTPAQPKLTRKSSMEYVVPDEKMKETDEKDGEKTKEHHSVVSHRRRASLILLPHSRPQSSLGKDGANAAGPTPSPPPPTSFQPQTKQTLSSFQYAVPKPAAPPPRELFNDRPLEPFIKPTPPELKVEYTPQKSGSSKISAAGTVILTDRPDSHKRASGGLHGLASLIQKKNEVDPDEE